MGRQDQPVIVRRYNMRVRLTFDERRMLEKMSKAAGVKMSTIFRQALVEKFNRGKEQKT